MTGPGSDRADAGRLVLAVDGGNVKTDVALLQGDGRLLAVVRGGGSSPHYLGADGAIGLLGRLVERAVERAQVVPARRPLAASAYLLLAGVDLPEELAAVRDRIGRLELSEQLVVDNDTFALLRAGTDRGWGVAVVCGAGINCLGLAPDGRQARFLSFGEISGDWGGGADVGMAALYAAARSADGRGPQTVLEHAVPAHFGLDGALGVSRALHLKEIPVSRLGELAPVVFAVADEDAVAARIVQRLADEAIAFARAALFRLDLTAEDPDVVLGGRLLRALPANAVDTIVAGVREVAPRAHVLVSPSEPIVGAALLALDALGAEAAAIARARAGLDAAVTKLEVGGGDDGGAVASSGELLQR